MATTISVNKQTVKELLGTGKETPFVIPEYQRPYSWTKEEVQVLFDDLWEFTERKGGAEQNGTYFLGSIVSYKNDNGEQEIIDGQQRITTLFLLLRAIYTKLQDSAGKSDEKANFFVKEIEPTIWRIGKLNGKVDYSNILLESKVIRNEGNEILKDILKTGKADAKAEDNYSINYLLLQKLFADKIASDILGTAVYNFVYAILNQAILLPITADDQDTALTIFSTLNDRGMPLSDADIFKAKIYNQLSNEEKKDFIDQWKNLDEEANNTNETIQQLFYYYMFYLRALEGNIDTTIQGVRKYYLDEKCKRLFEKDLMHNLKVILDMWKVIKNHISFENQAWSTNQEILKTLDTLSSYPNEFWKYPVIIFYLKYYKTNTFENDFIVFLHKLAEVIFTVYLEFSTVSAIKGDIIKLNVDILKTNKPNFNFKYYKTQNLGDKIKEPHSKSVRMLLKMIAYDAKEQASLLPDRWEIEHIFPQKWSSSYFPKDYTNEYIEKKIEHIGNKTPFEKKLNIKASNNYFNEKKKEYKQSKIAITKEMSEFPHEWQLEDIEERDIRISDAIIKLFNKWDNEYKNITEIKAIPTEEDLAKIAEFKAKGFI